MGSKLCRKALSNHRSSELSAEDKGDGVYKGLLIKLITPITPILYYITHIKDSSSEFVCLLHGYIIETNNIGEDIMRKLRWW